MVHLLIHSHPGVRAGSRVGRSRSNNVGTRRGRHGCRKDHGRRKDQGRRGNHPQTKDDPCEWHHRHRG